MIAALQAEIAAATLPEVKARLRGRLLRLLYLCSIQEVTDG